MAVNTNVLVVSDTAAEVVGAVDTSAPLVLCKDTGRIRYKNGSWQDVMAADLAAMIVTSDSRLSDARVPTGNAGGALSGTYPNPSIGAAQVTNAMLAGSIDATSKLTGQAPFAQGANAGTAATTATTGTMTVNMTTGCVTITPTGACTFNASGGLTGQLCTFVITTSGTSSFVLTFGTSFKSTGTLSTGTTSGKVFTVTFRCTNGSQWVEIGRTTAM